MQNTGRTLVAEEARLYTTEFRLYGLLHMPSTVGTAWLLNMADRPYLPVTRCMVYGAGHAHPPDAADLRYETAFAAVPKDHILWVVGGRQDEVTGALAREQRRVFVMFGSYVVSGGLYLPPAQRVSDFLTGALGTRPFVNLYDARVLVPRPGTPLQALEPVQEHPFVTVNLKRAGGIFDVREARGAPFGTDPGSASS